MVWIIGGGALALMIIVVSNSIKNAKRYEEPPFYLDWPETLDDKEDN